MFLTTLVKSDSKLGYVDKKDKLLYQLFLDKLKDGQEVEVYFSIKGSKANASQIAKVHASIREISSELGFSFEDMKLIVKEKAGLCFEVVDDEDKRVVCKSFADCSYTEISLAIEACNQIAEKNGIILG